MAYSYLTAGSPVTFYTPEEYYQDQFQSFVNDQFDIASDVYSVSKETYFASGSYNKISVRINHAIDSETGMKLGDDWKVYIFKNSASSVDLGTKFWTDNNYWLTVFTDNYKGLTSSVTVRRCNNMLRWRTESGSYLSEPCIIDYSIATPNNKVRTDPLLPEGTIKVFTQLNDRTIYIKENQRFLFGQSTNNSWSCFRVYGGGIAGFLNNQTMSNTSAHLLQLALGKDFVNESLDDLTNGIADYYKYLSGSAIVDSVQIIPISGSVLESGSQIFSVYRYSGTTQTSDVFTFTVSGSSTAPTANYTFATIDDNHFSVSNIARDLSNPLLIQCQSGAYLRVKEIYLVGLW